MPDSKYTAENEYSDVEMLALWRECFARISVSGQSYQMNIGGGTRMYTGANVQEVRENIDWLDERIARAEAASGGQRPVNYARMTRG